MLASFLRTGRRAIRQHYRETQRQQKAYESYKNNFQQPVSPFLEDEDFFKGYEEIIDVETELPTRGMLTICPTPIGNLGDMTFRSYRTLRKADIIACEDTRVTGMLLQLLAKFKGGQVHPPRVLETPEIDEYSYGLAGDFIDYTVKKVAETRLQKGRGLMISFNAHNQENRTAKLVKIMKSGLSVALVSDAGTPLLSDPGGVLVSEAIRAGVSVECLPGPVAAVVALTASGFPCDNFFFQGYLSKTDSEKVEKLRKMYEANCSAVVYESCHRIVETLGSIEQVFGPLHPIYIGQELTKLHETHHHGTVSSVLERFKSMERVFGELSIVIGPSGFKGTSSSTEEVKVNLKDLVAIFEASVTATDKEKREVLMKLTGASRNRLGKIVRELKQQVKDALRTEDPDDDLGPVGP